MLRSQIFIIDTNDVPPQKKHKKHKHKKHKKKKLMHDDNDGFVSISSPDKKRIKIKKDDKRYIYIVKFLDSLEFNAQYIHKTYMCVIYIF